MTLVDRVVLLATGLVALYLILQLYKDYGQTKRNSDLYTIISMAVLFVSGVLLILFGYGILQSPLVVIVAALIPVCLSLGLVAEFFPQYEKSYLYFAVVGVLAIAVTRFVGPSVLATIVLIIVHSVAGLIIVGVPVLAVSQGKAPAGFAFVSLGGILIDLGGIALAFLKLGKQFLFFSEEVVFLILAPLLLLMTLAFTWGFVKKLQAA